MKKRFLAFVLLLPLTVLGQKMSDVDSAWDGRNGLSGPSSTNLFVVCRELTRKQPDNPDAWWKYSRALNYYGMYFVTDNARMKVVFQKAKEAALTATMLAPDGLDGRLWLAVSLGNWGQANGVLNSLMVVPDIEQNMNEVLTRDPGRSQATAYTVLGRLYFKTPPRPLSVGDDTKAESYMKQAIEMVPARIKNYLYLAEMYYDWKHYDEALKTVETGERLPPRTDYALEDRFDLKELKALKQKLLARMKK